MTPSHSSSQTEERVEWIRASMERHEAELLRYALSLVGDLPSAEDLVQDAFFKLCKQDAAALRGRLVPWLFTVVRNQALDRHRRESRWPRASESEAAELAGPQPRGVDGCAAAPSAGGGASQVPEPAQLP
jgi:RNA polymerase sigma factor (sigma-70 family)